MTTWPLNRIEAWDENPRIKEDAQHIAELKASIMAIEAKSPGHGLLQNLVIAPKPGSDDVALVICGSSRLDALKELQAEGKIPADYAVPVTFRDIDVNDPDALMMALTENVTRRQMDIIDECIGMAKLAKAGKSVEEIAAGFGLKAKTVKQRIALGSLVPEAQALIREGKRDLDWGRALTLADPATQAKICADVATNPVAWKDGAEIRRYLTSETIPSDHALFDKALYKGRMIYDMFDGDRMADRAEFWELQNQAIAAKKAEFEAAGWSAVEISNNPVDLWRYRKSDNPAEAKVIIEVTPNGKVMFHTGLVDPQPQETAVDDEGSHLDVETHAQAADAPLTGDAVRATPGLLEYAAAQRSAMVQVAVSTSFRAALEVATAGLIGHGEIAIRAQDYRFPGSQDIRGTEAFAAAGKLRDDIADVLTQGGVPATGREDSKVLAFVRSLSDEALQKLFSQLVAVKVGQASARKLDARQDSLMNTLGQALVGDIRAHWTPDAAFFNLMTAEDLRRLATHLLPRDRQSGIMSAGKKHLVQMLSDVFADAREGDGSLDAETAARLNVWVPGPMMFPAQDDALRALAETAADEADPFAAIFGEAAE